MTLTSLRKTRFHSVWNTSTLWTSFWSSGPLNQHVYYPTLATVMTKTKSVVSRNLALNINATLWAVRLTGRVFGKPDEFMSKKNRAELNSSQHLHIKLIILRRNSSVDTEMETEAKYIIVVIM